MKKLRVAELFAGVGGFRLGIESALKKKKIKPEFVFTNQWEPSTKAQHASDIYVARFGEAGHSNKDIEQVPIEDIPDHDLLCGGFPCQDYSVATTLRSSKGLLGKKGVLWWQIERILREKGDKSPSVVFLENVDRLLKSPANQRGRDFAIMLASLNDLGYAVEWRVVNAADYGMPQRRRRVFILAYKKDSPLEKQIRSADADDWMLDRGVFAQAFPAEQALKLRATKDTIKGDLIKISSSFNKEGSVLSAFRSAGTCIDRTFESFDVQAVYNGKRTLLGDILVDESTVPEEYVIAEIDNLEQELERDPSLKSHYSNFPSLRRWITEKGAKRKEKINREGIPYVFAEGGMVFPDPLDMPSRPIITSEGGNTPSRFKHVVKVDNRLRRLVPVELERLNMFPDNHTEGISDTKRAFTMGNALVVGVIERVMETLASQNTLA
jgi:DNA (cytosine-5)-methyltransferase 1